eukprot:TRINITY_DN32084_c0_g1_i3.p1 TRINITY_DN32084_c0_g1~~TRINITY_DN32084_c0_g1_i3.p1  ORF type:complete len:332 (+),score=102.36 TRINITY_DN32084_c0_g1_i3:38-1033(+)
MLSPRGAPAMWEGDVGQSPSGTFEWLVGAEEAWGWLAEGLAALGEGAADAAPMRIAVLGSGTSRFSEVAADSGRCGEVLNVDYRPDFIREMREREQRRGGCGAPQRWEEADLCAQTEDSVAVLRAAFGGPLCDLAVDKGTVDQVICEGAAHYAALVLRACAALRPGGVLAVVTACADSVVTPFWSPLLFDPVAPPSEGGSTCLRRLRPTAGGATQQLSLWLLRRSDSALPPQSLYTTAAQAAAQELAGAADALSAEEEAGIRERFVAAAGGSSSAALSVSAAYGVVCPPGSALAEQYTAADWAADVQQQLGVAADGLLSCAELVRCVRALA